MMWREPKRYAVILLAVVSIFCLSALPSLSADNRIPVSSADGIGVKNRSSEHCRTCIQPAKFHESLTFGTHYRFTSTCALNSRVWYKCQQAHGWAGENPQTDCNLSVGCILFAGSGPGSTLEGACHYGSGISWECEYTETLADLEARRRQYPISMHPGTVPVSEEDYARLFGKTREEVFSYGNGTRERYLPVYENALRKTGEAMERLQRELDTWRDEQARTMPEQVTHAKAEEKRLLDEAERLREERKRAEEMARREAEAEEQARLEEEERRAERGREQTRQTISTISSIFMGLMGGAAALKGIPVNIPAFPTTGMPSSSVSPGGSGKYSPAQCNQIKGQIAEYDRCINETNANLQKGAYAIGRSQAEAALRSFQQARQENQNIYNQHCR